MKFSEMPYERVDLEKLKADFAALERDFDAAGSGEEQFRVHQRYYAVTGHAITEMTIAEIRHDIDMTDEFYREEQKYCDEIRPVFQNLCVSYQKKLYASPYRAYLESVIGPVAFRNMELEAKSVDPRIIPLMQEENRLQDAYNHILATAKIDWNGETLNLSLLEPYLRSADRRTRIEAYAKRDAFYLAHAEEFDDLYDRLVKNRTEQARTLGYENYLTLGDYRMMRNCWNRDDLRRFRAQIRKDYVDFAEALQAGRKERLRLDALHFYDEDVYFTEGNPVPVGTPEQILEAGRKMYHALSPETGKFMDFMCGGELFDVLGRKTKKTGGYMTYLPDYKAPFIFANFNGTTGDADVITHECGHAFQGWLSADDPIREHADITMETAETHSMSMEFFTEPWMDLFFGARGKDYVRMHLEDAINFIPYGTMVDEFQDIAYSNPDLSPKERNEAWMDLERQYRPHMNYEGDAFLSSGRAWQMKHHIYDCPLYYIDYCIAGTNALQYKIWMTKNYQEAWASYLKLCRLSASDFFFGLMDKVGLDNPFEDGCIRHVVKQLEEFV